MSSNLTKRLNRIICLLLALVMTVGFIPVSALADAKYDAYIKELEDYNARKAAYDAYLQEIAYYNAHNAEWVDYDAKLEQYNAYTKYLSDLDAYYTDKETYDSRLAAYLAYNQYVENLAKCEEKLEIIEAVINGDMYDTLTGDTVETVLQNEDTIAGYTTVSKKAVSDAGDATHALIEILKAYLGKSSIRDKFDCYKTNYSSLKSNFNQLYSCLKELYNDNAVKAKLKMEGKVYRYCEFLCQLYTIALCLDDSKTVNKNWKIFGESGDLSYSQLGGYCGLEDKSDKIASPADLTLPKEVPPAEYPETPVMPTQVAEVLEPIMPSGKRPVYPAPVSEPGNPPSPPTYKITWKNYDGTVLKIENVAYGVTPTYNDTPTRASTAQYTYNFTGWSPSVSTVSGDATYTAQFEAKNNSYTITWKNYDGTVLKTENLSYGDMPSYSGTPTKASTAQNTYTFSGWTPSVTAVSGNAVYTATFTETTNKYTVTWKNYDGTVLKTETLPYGETPKYNGTPTRASTAQYTYNFTGWSPSVSTVSGNATYTAQFEAQYNSYTITWKNYDGTVLKTESLEYGEMPYYGGTPTKASTAQNTYTFSGWTPSVTAVSGNAVYTAKYTETTNKYTVTWKNYDGTVLKTESLEYGETPSYNGTPKRAATAQYTYTFSAWSPTLTSVKSDVTYTAQFSETVNKYTVTWKNYDGTVLKTETLPYGETPKYNGTPTRAATAQYTYTFSDWLPSIVSLQSDAVYTAQYTETVNKYTVTWKNYNGSVIKTDTVEYGTVPHYSGETPTKPGNSQNSYMFDTWSPTVSEIKGDVSYTATFTASTNKYTVTWNNYDGTLLEKDTDIEYGATPSYNGAVPKKSGNGQYSYVFAGWSPELASVSGNATYTATFYQVENQYEVVWKNYDGSVLKTDTLTYGATPSYSGTTPTKPSTAQYTYSFDAWMPAVTTVTENATYTATFKSVENAYTVTWKNYDGTVLKTETLNYGATPYYGNSAPEKPSTAQYTYTFDVWTPALSAVTGNVTYTATFKSVENAYIVTWNNYDGTLIKKDTGVMYGSKPEYVGNTPVKPGNEQYSYVFSGWTPAISNVDGDVSYTAVFDTVENSYTVTWADYDGTTLKTETLGYGLTPFYSGKTPEKAEDARYSYSFQGWSPNIVPVNGDIVYTAIYGETVKIYIVEWKNYDGTVLKTDKIAYGETPEYDGQMPQKQNTIKYVYEFAGWTPKISEVNGNASYTAEFTETLKIYTVVWKDGNTVLQSDKLYYGDMPVYYGNTEKEPTKEKTFEFLGWSPEVSSVSGDVVYTAVYKESTVYYGVVWKIGDTVLPEQLYEYMQSPKEPSNPGQYLGDDERSLLKFVRWDKNVGPVTDNITYTAVFYADIFDLATENKNNVYLSPSKNIYTVLTEKEDLPIGLSKLAEVASSNGKDITIEYENGVQVYFPNALAREIIEKKLHVSLIIGNTVQEFELLSDKHLENASEDTIFGGRIVLTDGEGNIVPLTGWQLRIPVKDGNMNGLSGYVVDNGERGYKLAQTGNYAVFVSDGSSEFKLVRKLSVRVETNGGGNVSFGNSEIKAGNTVKADVNVAIGYEIESVEVYYDKDGEKVPVEFDNDLMTFVMPEYNVVFSIKFKMLTFTVNFYVDGTLYSTAVYKYGDDLILPEAPVKSDDSGVSYDFLGWTPDVSAKVFADADYNAKFNGSTVADDDYGNVNHGFNFPYKLFIIVVAFFGTVGLVAFFVVKLAKKRKNSKNK